MKPAPFRHVWADTAESAVRLLAESGDEARILAGGQSLVPLMAMRLATPSMLVDISRSAPLHRVDTSAGALTVGAAVTCRRLERDGNLAGHHPLLTATMPYIGHPEIRARGTVCGSITHADPAAELPAVLLATGGSVRILGPAGERAVTAGDFFLGPFTTALDEAEMVTAVELPLPAPTAGWSVLEVARRHGDFALVGVICVVDLDADGRYRDPSIALFGVAGTPVRSRAAEQALAGQPPEPEVLDAATAVAFDDIEVLGDIHAPSGYRRRAGQTLVRRGLAEATRRLAANRAGAAP